MRGPLMYFEVFVIAGAMVVVVDAMITVMELIDVAMALVVQVVVEEEVVHRVAVMTMEKMAPCSNRINSTPQSPQPQPQKTMQNA